MTTTSHEERRRRLREVGFNYDATKKTVIRRCNLCGADRFVTVTHKDRYGFKVPACGCLRCGLVFLSQRMTADEYERFYVETYRPLVSAFHGRRIDAETIQAEQNTYAANLVEFLFLFVAPGKHKTLLDIGGSTGVVAHVLSQKLGVEATILDPSPKELEHARAFGLIIVPGLLENYEPDGACYDVITMCQTVDHLLDISGAFSKVNKLLASGGLFFLDFVDFRAAYLREKSVEVATKIDHPFCLTESTMKVYLARAGFEALRTDYAADHLHVGYVCRKVEPVPDFLPDQSTVEQLWKEIRMIQNFPGDSGYGL